MTLKLSWWKVSRRLHLYLRLSVDVLLTIITLSDFVLVYYLQIDSLPNPTNDTTTSLKTSNWDQAYNTLRVNSPAKQRPWQLENTGLNTQRLLGAIFSNLDAQLTFFITNWNDRPPRCRLYRHSHITSYYFWILCLVFKVRAMAKVTNI